MPIKDRIHGGKGLVWHYEAYDGPDTPFKAGVQEIPTLTCIHCGVVVMLNPERKRDRHFCFKCNHYVCDKPGCILNCNPWQRTLDVLMQKPESGVSLHRDDLGYLVHDESLEDISRIFPSAVADAQSSRVIDLSELSKGGQS